MTVSCGQRTGSRAAAGSPSSVIDSLEVGGEPFELCRQVLTSLDALESIDVPADSSYDTESTPDRYSYFYPEDDIEVTPEVERYALLYNVATVYNHVVHSYELHCRKLSSVDDSLMTKKDSLDIIAHDVYLPSRQLMSDVVRDRRMLNEVSRLLDAAARYDGDASEGSPFALAMKRYSDKTSNLGMPVDDATLDSFTDEFWDWYDKKRYVPQIDRMMRLRLGDSDENLTQPQLEHLREVVLSERDIDRRTILALEYAKWNEYDGAILLGEILESGIYTRYILEAWVTWRACVQMTFIGPSSFCTIPNNYYDRIRVKCMNTIIRHMQSPEEDRYAACLLTNLLYCQILHRQASIVGNESLATLANLKNWEFVHPDALGGDYLKEE